MRKVFVSGCFDIIHGGHIEFFLQAKKLGDYLIVSVASDESLWIHKKRKPSIPIDHKVRLLQSLKMIDEVVVGSDNELGLDFKTNFLRIKPQILIATEDDKYEIQKRELCKIIDAEYIKLPKTLNFEKISTTEIIDIIKAPSEIPLRVDFAGGWRDVPKYANPGSFIVNCAISPTVSLKEWNYQQSSGLGGSAAYSILMGKDSIKTELEMGVGWQDPAIIKETGLCVWRSGEKPILELKRNPDFLKGKMGLLYTGKNHYTPSKVDLKRNYDLIDKAGYVGMLGVLHADLYKLRDAINLSYEVQIDEGMNELPEIKNSIAKKYCGSGWGGYALYLFETEDNNDLVKIEPFIK